MSFSEIRSSEINNAIMSGDLVKIRELGLNKAEINAPFIDTNGLNFSILQYTVGMGKVNVIPELINLGANINVKDFHNCPLLHDIISKCVTEEGVDRRRKWHEILELFLSNGADYDAKSKDGHTALSHAVLFRAHDVVDILEAHGARGRYI